MTAKAQRHVYHGVLKKLRARYATTWGRAWPLDNPYLSELWLESQAACGGPHIGKHAEPVYEWCLGLMYENKESDDDRAKPLAEETEEAETENVH